MTPANNLPNGGTAPSLTAITTNISGMAYAVNDLGHFAIQINHDCAASSDLKLHCHFVFPSQPTAGRTVRWEVYYSLGGVGAAFSAESVAQYGEYTIVASDDKIHRAQSICTISGLAAPQSCAIIGRIMRVASTGSESDVNPILLFVDAHYQRGPYGTYAEFS
jgi:hypothetical protein